MMLTFGENSCAFGPCPRSLERGGPGCDMCDRVAKLPQPVFKDAIHEREKINPERDGVPTLAAAKERRHPMWEKRHRQGPHRGNA